MLFNNLFKFFQDYNKNHEINMKNKRSSEIYEWDPSWFRAEAFDKNLSNNIRNFQKQMQIDETGIVDSSTFRRKMTERECVAVALKEKLDHRKKNSIICNGKKVDIEWGKVKTFRDMNFNFNLPGNCYKKVSYERKPTLFVNHWDVCLESSSCYEILKKRGISVHFMIDNDGTIYQLLDTNDIAWHARPFNSKSIGVEISNAYYTKYQRTYESMGFDRRPIMTDIKVHGRKLDPFLGFYPIQLEALKALTKSVCKAHDIPMEIPTKDGKLIEGVYDVRENNFSGIVSHYHLNEKKIDCAGLDLESVIN